MISVFAMLRDRLRNQVNAVTVQVLTLSVKLSFATTNTNRSCHLSFKEAQENIMQLAFLSYVF